MQTNDERQILCDNIKLLRKTLGLSKKEMARRIKISVFSLNKLENGILPPRLNIELLIHIYWQFGVSPSQMFAPNLGIE